MSGFRFRFDRQETLTALEHLRVSIPTATKLSDDELEKRLDKAVDASQLSRKILKRSFLDVNNLKLWPHNRAVLEPMYRGQPNEAYHDAVANLFRDRVMDLRRVLMGVAQAFDSGLTSVGIQDKDHEKCAVNLKVRDKCYLARYVLLCFGSLGYRSSTSTNLTRRRLSL